MKTQTFKEFYQELLIRWGVDWETAEIEEKDYPFGMYLRRDCEGRIQIAEDFGKRFGIFNCNGLIYFNGTWATRKLKEAPEKWVVEKNEEHPMWGKCLNWLVENIYGSNFRGEKGLYYFGTQGCSESLKAHTLSQYLTLDQWAEFFLNEPKAGELHLFHDGDGEFSIAKFKEMNTRKGKEIYPFVDEHDHVWKYCDALSDEAQAILNREIKNIKIK